MRKALAEIRITVAEWLMAQGILRVMPDGSPEKLVAARMLVWYLETVRPALRTPQNPGSLPRPARFDPSGKG